MKFDKNFVLGNLTDEKLENMTDEEILEFVSFYNNITK